jgi:hypothetical protein
MDNSVAPAVDRSAAVGNSIHASQAVSGERMFFDSTGSTLPQSAPPSESSHIEEFGLRHLKTAAEIEQILYLREAIDLSVHSNAHTNFIALEKKETSAVLSAPSTCAGKS